MSLTSVAMNRPIEKAAAHDRNVIVVRHFLSLNGCKDMIPLTTQCHIAIYNEQTFFFFFIKILIFIIITFIIIVWYLLYNSGLLRLKTYLLSNPEHDEHEIKQDRPERRDVLGADHGERGRKQFGRQAHCLVSALLRHTRHVVLHRPLAQKQTAVLHPSHGRQVFAGLSGILLEQKRIGTHPF